MKNFTCSDNDSIYIFFHCQRNRSFGRNAFRMKHEKQNLSIGRRDRIVISALCFGRNTKEILQERVKVFSPYSEKYLI